jgi:hypothetical protein
MKYLLDTDILIDVLRGYPPSGGAVQLRAGVLIPPHPSPFPSYQAHNMTVFAPLLQVPPTFVRGTTTWFPLPAGGT